jgi:hypothetical protein
VSRRGFLGLVSAIFTSLALPVKAVARHGAHYAERFAKVLCAWAGDLEAETYNVKIFADADRNRIGVRSDGPWGLFVWELPLDDVRAFMKGRAAVKNARLHCRYENFTENYVKAMNALVEKNGERLIVRMVEGDRLEGRCEIDIRDIKCLLTCLHE